jgi:hypothetical protein
MSKKNFNPRHLYQPIDVLVADISGFYREEALTNGYSILGSLNILGNPSQIIRDFSGGHRAFHDDRGSNSVSSIPGADTIAKGAIGG